MKEKPKTETPPKPEDQMMQWITSKWITKPIHVIAELGIADLVRDKPMHVKDMAKHTGTHAPALYRLLRALAAVGVFAETNDREFGATPLSQCLCTGAMRPLARMFLAQWHDKAWDGLAHSVKTGEPGFEHVFGQPSFEWLEANPEARKGFDAAQGVKVMGFAKLALQACDFSGIQTVGDLGGGQGIFLTEILRAHPHLNGIVADLPGAMQAAQQQISETGLQDRGAFVTVDLFNDIPPSCDAYFMVNILHDWDDEPCRRILANIAKAMQAATKLFIFEYLIESGPAFSIAKLLDLEVLVMGGGRERSLEEYHVLAASAGMKLEKTTAFQEGPTAMMCTLA